MTSQEAISYLENQGWSKTRFGLDRTRELLEKLGNPQKRLKFIHVTGSNGKGSTCAMLESVLRRAGYRTGFYSSPHIENFRERIQVNGKWISEEDLIFHTMRVRTIAEKMSDHPSQFELVTAIGLDYFASRKCDIVVLEVGMGGALDSTNAIDAPEVAVITNVGLDHQEYLGNSIEEIAQTKAGIIKAGSDVVCYDGAPSVTEIIKEKCLTANANFHGVKNSRIHAPEMTLNGQRFLWDQQPLQLSLLGKHQLRNAATALTVLEILIRRGWHIDEEAVRKGLAMTEWPARMELLSKKPIVFLDGGHNPQCAEALAENLSALFPRQKVVFLMGVLKDKDYPRMIEILTPFTQQMICLTPSSDRALSAERLAEYLLRRGIRAEAADSVKEGIRLARKAAGRDGIIVAFGSLYLAGSIRNQMRIINRQPLD
ncbi:MAG: folylpolyglutamate synthase/dihydrofolate synthase family protein [Peptoniphilaceae bacterium]|nr:folylpolyglutamate synthase/dihydrofolate synthase family protein [Peptoniphilaceae bacterium]MDY5842344.1 folylpolyglutamate synthase/dihydrofolate synthase family protein [Peptoniphilaceae bacterium]MDY6146532.1 folylpolyglutamate synthase/dihydrofolate synthase family protein [Peptoniphilaceae bacterium]